MAPKTEPTNERMGVPGIIATRLAFVCSLAACAVNVASARGVRHDAEAAAAMDANMVLQELGTHIAVCGDLRRTGPGGVASALPPSTDAVPRDTPRGTEVLTAPADWSAEAFRCAGFERPHGQRFQYQWVQTQADKYYPSKGEVRAVGDLDGDGRPDHKMSMGVACEARFCTVAPITVAMP